MLELPSTDLNKNVQLFRFRGQKCRVPLKLACPTNDFEVDGQGEPQGYHNKGNES